MAFKVQSLVAVEDIEKIAEGIVQQRVSLSELVGVQIEIRERDLPRLRALANALPGVALEPECPGCDAIKRGIALDDRSTRMHEELHALRGEAPRG